MATVIRYNCIGHTPAPEGKPVYRARQVVDGSPGPVLGYAHTAQELVDNMTAIFPDAMLRMVSPAVAGDSKRLMDEYFEHKRKEAMRQKIMIAVKAGQKPAAMAAGVPAVTGEMWFALVFMSESALKGVCRELNIAV